MSCAKFLKRESSGLLKQSKSRSVSSAVIHKESSQKYKKKIHESWNYYIRVNANKDPLPIAIVKKNIANSAQSERERKNSSRVRLCNGNPAQLNSLSIDWTVFFYTNSEFRVVLREVMTNIIQKYLSCVYNKKISVEFETCRKCKSTTF